MRALLWILTACSIEPAVPRSLEGTDVDGALTALNGEFLFDARAQQAFDYFLTASGELDDRALEEWVARELELRLPESAAKSGLAAWREYTAYRREAAAILERGAGEAELLAALERNLGRHPIAAAERMRITRAQQPEALDGPALRFLTARNAIALARSTGAGPAEIRALRTAYFGEAAAERLHALDARRADWARRLDAFRSARTALLAQTPPADRDRALSRLEAAHFDEPELRRVRALDRISTAR